MDNCTNVYQKENLSCGLDFGTSNSVISITDLTTRKEIYTYSVPSILYFPEATPGICYIGKEAEKKYVEEEMKGRLLKSVKTLLKQDRFLFTWIGGKQITPEQMASYIIRQLKDKAEEFLGFNIDKVVLGRPAIFSENEQEEKTAVTRLLAAAQIAGFKEIQLQLEPIAAALSYEQNLLHEETILVADFGGGTSDFTIIRLSPDKIQKKNRSKDILAHGGLYIGGDLFDSEIMWQQITPLLGRGVEYQSYGKKIEIPHTIYRELRSWERSFLLKESKARRMMDKYYVFSDHNPRVNNVRTLIDRNYVYSLFKEIEKNKIKLTTDEQTLFRFLKPDLNIETSLTYGEYKNIIAQYVDKIRDYIEKMMRDTGFETNNIDAVYLTGGSSLTRPIRELFDDMFSKENIRMGNTFHSVAHGLSLGRW